MSKEIISPNGHVFFFQTSSESARTSRINRKMTDLTSIGYSFWAVENFDEHKDMYSMSDYDDLAKHYEDYKWALKSFKKFKAFF